MKKMNFYEMVMAQKMTGREILGTRGTLVLDQDTYEITEVKADKLVMTQVLPEDSEEKANAVEITAANGIAMKYQLNPNPKAKVEATFEDGTLKFGEMSVSCGTLPITGVLVTIPGYIFLKAEALEPEKIGVYVYDVQFDSFTETDMVLSEDAYAVELECGTYIVSNIVRDVTLVDAFGVPTGETTKVLEEARLILVEYKWDLSPMLVFGLNFDSPIASVRRVENDAVAVVTDQMTDENGFLVPAKKNMIRVFSATLSDKLCSFYATNADAQIYIGGKYGDVYTCVDGDDAIVIKNHRGTAVITDKEVVVALAGYTTFCSVEGTKSDKDELVTIWTYCNNDLEVKSFTQTATDRGVLFAIV